MPATTDTGHSSCQLGDCLAHAAESQHRLFQEMAIFARDETSRFINLRLERNSEAWEKMQDCHGLPGLIGLQQEWLRVLVEDCLGQQLRLAGAFQTLAQKITANATGTASENIERMQQDGREMAEVASHRMSQMAPDANNYARETQH